MSLPATYNCGGVGATWPCFQRIALLGFYFRLNQVPAVRSPSITSSHLNAVAPLVRINRINSDAESVVYSRVTSVVPKGTYRSAAGLKVFSDRKELAEPKRVSPPRTGSVQAVGVVPSNSGSRRTSPPIYVDAKGQRAAAAGGYVNLSGPPQSKTKGERLEEQRQRRELRKRETLTTTPNIRARPTSIFDSLSKRR